MDGPILENSFSFPRTPKLNLNLTNGEKPEVALDFDESNMLSVDVYYTQQGQLMGRKIIPVIPRIAFGIM